MAITLVGAVTDTPSSAFDQTSVITIPAATEEGDTLVLYGVCDRYVGNIVAPATPAGWTQVGLWQNGTTELFIVWTRVATEDDAGSTVTVGWNYAAFVNHLRVFRGADLSIARSSGWVFDSNQGTGGVRHQAVTISVAAGELVLVFGGSTGTAVVNADSGNPSTTSTYLPRFDGGTVSDFGIGPVAAWAVAGTLSEITARETVRVYATAGGSTFGQLGVLVLAVPEFVEPPPPLQDPRDRLRSSISADSGSILAAAQAVPFDASHSITFNPAQYLTQTTLYPYREVTRAQDAGPVDVVFLPRAVQNTQEERAYDGVTVLSLMARVFPAPLVGLATTLGLPDNRANSWIEYAFGQWAAEYPWFTYEPIPDIRYPIPGSDGVAKPSEYFDVLPGFAPRLGVVRSDAIRFSQDDNNRLSMLEILESLLSAYPGTIYFINSAGNLQLVPAYGPDADETAYRTLTNTLVTRQSLGEPSAFGIINRATVASRGLTAGLTPVMEPAWFQIGARELFGFLEDAALDRVWYDPRAAATNLQPPADETLVLQEELTPADAFTAQAISGWQIADPALFAAGSIRLVDETSAPLVTAAYKRFNLLGGVATLAASGTGTFALVEEEVPTDGVWRRTLGWSLTVGVVNFLLYMDARWNAGTQTVEWRVGAGSGDLSWNGAPAERIRIIVEFTLDDLSQGFVEQPGANVTYGVEGDALYDESIGPSQAAFGVLEERIDVRGYYLNAVQALDIARGYVLANIQPRVTREVELGWLGSTQVLFDDRGRRVELPNGDVGRLVGVSYSDDFVSVTGGKSVRVEVELLGAPGSLPAGVLLLNDDNSFWQNEDFSTSEVA